MRNISVLSNDFVRFNRTLAECEANIGKMNSSFVNDTLLDESATPAAFLNMKYSDSFRAISEYDFKSNLFSISNQLLKNNSISLKESVAFSKAINSCLGISDKDDIANAVLAFSLAESDIPEEDEYKVTYSNIGRQRAIGFITELQEEAYKGQKLLKSNDIDNVLVGIKILAPIYTLCESSK